MLKITRGREGTGGREGGYRNQRELSTAGRWQTDTHTSNTHAHTLSTTHRNFKHLNVSVWRLCPYNDLLNLAGRNL